MKRMVQTMFVGLVVAGLSTSALAAMPGGGGEAAGAKKHEPGDATKKKKRKDKAIKKSGDYFVLEDIKIEGKVYKPEAFHVVNRKELSLRWDIEDPRFGGNFLKRIMASVKRRPF